MLIFALKLTNTLLANVKCQQISCSNTTAKTRNRWNNQAKCIKTSQSQSLQQPSRPIWRPTPACSVTSPRSSLFRIYDTLFQIGFVTSSWPLPCLLTGHTPMVWRWSWRVAKNSMAKPAADQNSHRCTPRTCSMQSEVTSVDLKRRGLNSMLLNEITNPDTPGCCVTIATQQPDVSTYTGIYQMRCTAYKVAPEDGLTQSETCRASNGK